MVGVRALVSRAICWRNLRRVWCELAILQGFLSFFYFFLFSFLSFEKGRVCVVWRSKTVPDTD